MKKKLGILLCFSDNIAFAAGNVSIALNRYLSVKDYEILLYHTELSAVNIAALKKIPNTRLVEFKFPTKFEEMMLKRLPEGRWKSKNALLSLAHFEVFNLLNEYQTVIWLDTDMSIQGDISGLIKYCPLGLAKDINRNNVWKVKDQFVKPIVGYNMKLDSHINACIVVSDSLKNYEKMATYCYNKAVEYASYLKNPDQAIFQLLFQDFNLTPNLIPWNDYVCHPYHDCASISKIVHFGGAKKIWNDSYLLKSFPEWFRVHLEWLNLGGSDFDRSNISTRSIYADITNPTKSFETPIKQKIGWAIVRKLKKNSCVNKLLSVPIFPKKKGDEGKFYRLKDLLRPVYRKILR